MELPSLWLLEGSAWANWESIHAPHIKLHQYSKFNVIASSKVASSKLMMPFNRSWWIFENRQSNHVLRSEPYLSPWEGQDLVEKSQLQDTSNLKVWAWTTGTWYKTIFMLQPHNAICKGGSGSQDPWTYHLGTRNERKCWRESSGLEKGIVMLMRRILSFFLCVLKCSL